MTNPDYFDKVKSAKDTQVGGDHYKKLKIQVSDYLYENNFELAIKVQCYKVSK
jgi:hypothetical protein